MCDVKWVKLSTNTYNDSKLLKIESSLNGDAKVNIWYKLLQLAGKSNNGGRLSFTEKIPYSIEDLAIEFNKSLGIVQQAIDDFLEFEMLAYEDSFFVLTSWYEYQNVERMEELKDNDRQKELKRKYNQRYRDKQKAKLNEEKKEQNEKKEEEKRTSQKSSQKEKKNFSKVSQDVLSEKEKISHNVLSSYYKEKELDIDTEKEKRSSVYEYFLSQTTNMALPTTIAEMFPDWEREYNEDVIRRAIDIAVEKNGMSLRFWETTLKNISQGIDFSKPKNNDNHIYVKEPKKVENPWA